MRRHGAVERNSGANKGAHGREPGTFEESAPVAVATPAKDKPVSHVGVVLIKANNPLSSVFAIALSFHLRSEPMRTNQYLGPAHKAQRPSYRRVR